MKIRAFFFAAMLLPFSFVHASPDLAETQKSAEQGDATAQARLGAMYDEGLGVPQDDRQAAVWFRKAAEQGDASAQHSLGLMYETGRGVPQNYSLAYSWLSVAAAVGYEEASKSRDKVAKKLSSSQLEEAQKQAAQYFEQYQPRN